MGEVTLAGHLRVLPSSKRECCCKPIAARMRSFGNGVAWPSIRHCCSGYLDTCFGWRLHVTRETRPTSLQNHPMQSHGAEMLRLACSFSLRRALRYVRRFTTPLAPVRRQLTRLKRPSRLAQGIMARAARVVLNGVGVGRTPASCGGPHRYEDERGAGMDKVVTMLEEIEAREVSCFVIGKLQISDRNY